MKLPSDRVVEQLARCGGLAPVESVERNVSRATGVEKAHVGVSLALLARRVERVTMLDGRPGLRLVEPCR